MTRGDLVLTPAARTAEMDAAHRDAHVVAVAEHFLRHPLDGMVKLLVLGLTGPTDPARHRGFVLTAGLPNYAQDAAFGLLEEANELWPPDARGTFLRGAVLERVTRGLLDGRECEVLEEQHVGPFDGTWWAGGQSDPIDFVLPAQPEFYECKANIRRIEGRHINQFSLIQAIDEASLTAFVTLQKAATLIEWLSEFEVDRPMHAFTLEDFLRIAEGPATLVVAGPEAA